jgi:hydrogenase small subunit
MISRNNVSNEPATVYDTLQSQGIPRRAFLKFCAITASSLGISGMAVQAFSQALAAAPRPSVLWMSYQACTGCSESLLRSGDPLGNGLTVENLILNFISLDYDPTLMIAAGDRAEAARLAAIEANSGKYIVVVDGSLPTLENEWWMATGGQSGLAVLRETVDQAALVIAVGTCATSGGIPAALPNPSRAMGVADLMTAGLLPSRPLVNITGCPPVPEVLTGTIAYYLVNKALPPLDALLRPMLFYGKTVHDCCPRLPYFNAGEFASSFGDDGAKQGHCLLLLGCKGPETFNACTTNKWNQGTSSPTQAGHGCIGCSEPNFWDKPGGIYGFNTEFESGDGSACTAPSLPVLPVV